MAPQLDGKVALVTGAAGGIGRAVAERFLAEGARVLAFDRREATLAGKPEAWAAVTGDVRSPADNERAVAHALSRFGRLDVFVGNAGIYDNRRSFRGFSPAELDRAFDELFAVDVKGYLLGARAALDALTATRGCIVFTSSVSGTHAGFGGVLYIAAKHAVNGLTRQLALELAPHVRVNAVAPGFVPTGLSGIECLAQGQGSGGPTPADMPLQAIAQPQDYAAAYVFLASDASARTATGTVLALDAGTAVRGPRPASWDAPGPTG
ncbi:SDR family NAD(P)-dependent oxidoreductase [Ramlibacter rhizophilus]|uniref:SDR family oxidoreductase n=1 Tax=Ramlibacter rhizophilus TaxID=1781167 RepID=A0A4Z0BH51_9BURK|nr:SDR family NAD(P)-dependent oxidoreductase [Ramlibacter rhizophilus]TFY97454.1 SDR family oxidoreductase [Ramlibacter rhizophilus]